MREPLGVIGLLAPDDAPLLGAVSLLAPAIAMGNRVVLVPSWPAPLAATDLYQVLDTSDVPGGVVNIVTGDPGELGGTLASPSGCGRALVLFAAGWTPARSRPPRRAISKRVWMNHGGNPDWASSGGREVDGSSTAATETPSKTIWVPYGRSEGRRFSLRGKRKEKLEFFHTENARFPAPFTAVPAAQSFILAQRTATLSTKGSMTRSSNRSQIRQGHEDDQHHPQEDHDIDPRETTSTSGPETGVMATALG